MKHQYRRAAPGRPGQNHLRNRFAKLCLNAGIFAEPDGIRANPYDTAFYPTRCIGARGILSNVGTHGVAEDAGLFADIYRCGRSDPARA
jgi:hypothetical protein